MKYLKGQAAVHVYSSRVDLKHVFVNKISNYMKAEV